ncbi:uncharacterized protein WM277_003805 isoform 1-T1 [Molossus nigricans]
MHDCLLPLGPWLSVCGDQTPRREQGTTLSTCSSQALWWFFSFGSSSSTVRSWFNLAAVTSGPVPKRRLEIQQSQPVWELNNQQPTRVSAETEQLFRRRGRRAGAEQRNVEKERLTRGPGAHARCHGRSPPPARNPSLSVASTPAGRSLGLPGSWSRERRAVRPGRKSRTGPSRTRRPAAAAPPSSATSLQAPHSGARTVAWSDILWELRGAAVGRGRGAPRLCPGSPASLPRRNPRRDPGVRVPAAPAPCPRWACARQSAGSQPAAGVALCLRGLEGSRALSLFSSGHSLSLELTAWDRKPPWEVWKRVTQLPRVASPASDRV